jgi:hypothetical protein
MRIVVLDTWPCEPSLGGERFQGLTATASTGDQGGDRLLGSGVGRYKAFQQQD